MMLPGCKPQRGGAAALLALALVASACSSSGAPAATETTAPRVAPTLVAPPELGVITIPDGQAVAIRALVTQSGPAEFLGAANLAGIRQAIDDYGAVQGFSVDLGEPIDDGCGAVSIIDRVESEIDAGTVGFIGATCRGTDVEIAPVVSAANLVMISPSDLAPDLTAEGDGISGVNRRVGYYRTVHNAIVEAATAAQFATDGLRATRVAVVHDGTDYTETVAEAFVSEFDGPVAEIVKSATAGDAAFDAEAAAGEALRTNPDVVFVPLFNPDAERFVAAIRADPAGADVALIATRSLLQPDTVIAGGVDSVYFVIAPVPDPDAVSSTGSTASAVADAVRTAGADTDDTFWANAYDATVLLLTAIDAAATVVDGDLVVDRLAIRQELDGVRAMDGLSGELACDEFGDCADTALVVVQHDPGATIEATRTNIVFDRN